MDPIEDQLRRAVRTVVDAPDPVVPTAADIRRRGRRQQQRRATAVIGVVSLLIMLLAFTRRGSAPETSLDVVTAPRPGTSLVAPPSGPAPFPSGSAVDPKNRQLLVPAQMPPVESGVTVGFDTPTMGSFEGFGESQCRRPNGMQCNVLRLFVDDGTNDQEVCPNWSELETGDCGRSISAGGLTRKLWTAPEVTDPNGHKYTLHAALQATDDRGEPIVGEAEAHNLALVSNRVEILVKPRGTVTNGAGVQLGDGGGVTENVFRVIDQTYSSFASHDWAALDKHLSGPPALLGNEPGGWANTFGWVDGQFVIGTRYENAPNGSIIPSVTHAWVVLNGTSDAKSSSGSPTQPDGMHTIECVTMRLNFDASKTNFDNYSVEVIDVTHRESGPGRISMTEAIDLEKKPC